jgi:hypothetical protein
MKNACPNCGSINTSSTYVAYIPPAIDENIVKCECGWFGIGEDLVEETLEALCTRTCTCDYLLPKPGWPHKEDCKFLVANKAREGGPRHEYRHC